MCSICNSNPCLTQCPNHKEVKPLSYCSYCGEGIYVGEEYIENENGEKRHYDCIFGLRELLKWLGYEVKIMEEDND